MGFRLNIFTGQFDIVGSSGGGSLPTQVGNNYKVLQTDGSDASWTDVLSDGSNIPSISFGTRELSNSVGAPMITYFGASVNVNLKKITNLATPTAATDAATKGYVDTPTASKIAIRVHSANTNLTINALTDHAVIADTNVIGPTHNIILPVGVLGQTFKIGVVSGGATTFTLITSGGNTIDSAVNTVFASGNAGREVTFSGGVWYSTS